MILSYESATTSKAIQGAIILAALAIDVARARWEKRRLEMDGGVLATSRA